MKGCKYFFLPPINFHLVKLSQSNKKKCLEAVFFVDFTWFALKSYRDAPIWLKLSPYGKFPPYTTKILNFFLDLEFRCPKSRKTLDVLFEQTLTKTGFGTALFLLIFYMF